MANCSRCGRQLPPFSFKKICQWCVQHEAAQRGEDGDDARQRVIPAPWVRRAESDITVTHVIFGANVALFVAMVAATVVSTGTVSLDFSGEIEHHFGANYGPDTLSGEWWRLFTYMFLHSGPMHIFFNMWCLWDLGRLCESLYGRWTYAAIYVITGIAAGLTSVAWNPGVLSVGASGAIFGLAGALAASFYLGEFSVPKIAIRGTLRSLAFFIGFNVLFGLGFNIFAGSSGGIDNAAHIGGLVSGLALGALIARFAPQSDLPLRRTSVVGMVALAVLAAGLGVRQWRGGQVRLYKAFQAAEGDRAAQLQLIVRQQPNSAPLHFELAKTYFNQQQFPQAEAEFKRVLELQPQDADARFDLGMTYLNEKHPEEAKAMFAQMVAQDGQSANGHYGLGLALADQQNDQGAIEEFKKAASSGAQIPEMYLDMGNAYARLKQYDSAIASYLKEKEQNGDYPDLEKAFADVYEAKGMTQQAREAKDREAQLRGGAAGH